jgi:hypothetical protein
MSTDAFHRPGPSGMEPPASLTSVRVKRRASLVTPSGKRGDLTDGGDASTTPETMSAPEAPAITQAAMDAHHQAHIAEAAAVALPAETMYEAPPEERAYEASQPVIVLPPPVLNGEDRDAILPMTELLPEVAAEMHAQIRMDEQSREHEAAAAHAPEPEHIPEPIVHSYQPEYQPELLLTSPLPPEPESAADPEVSFEPESAAQARWAAEPEVTHERQVTHDPWVMHEPEIMHQPEVMHEPEVMHQPEIMHEPQRLHEPEFGAVPHFITEAEIIAEPEMMATAEPETMPELELAAPPEERQEPTLTMPSAESSDTVVQLPLATAEPAAEPPTPLPTVPEEVRAPDILDYWDSLRGVRDYPTVDELDRSHVAASWPNTVLLSFKTEIPQITRIGENNGEIEYTAMVTSWLMTRGRHAVKRGEPMEEEQKFPLSNGSGRYRLLVLPMLGKGGEACDHVLCQVTRAQERSAVASFKRWLAG